MMVRVVGHPRQDAVLLSDERCMSTRLIEDWIDGAEGGELPKFYSAVMLPSKGYQKRMVQML